MELGAGEVQVITQGEDIRLCLFVRNVDQTPYDLTGVTTITVKLAKADGTAMSKTYPGGGVSIVGDPISSRLEVVLADTDTALLMPRELQEIEVLMDFAGETRNGRTGRQLTVRPALF